MRFQFFFLIFTFHFLHYQDSGLAQSQLTVAVLEFNNSADLSSNELSALTQRFRSILTSRQVVTVLERDKMSEILKEQDFILSDNCNTKECAVQVGQLLGVQVMVSGEFGKVGDAYSIDIRCIDVETGRIFSPLNANFGGKKEGLLNVVEDIAETIKFDSKTTPNRLIFNEAEIRLKLIAGPTFSLAHSSFFHPGYYTAISAVFPISARISIDAGLSYIVKKASQKVAAKPKPSIYSYMELPLFLHYTVYEHLISRAHWNASIGFAPAFRLKAKYENAEGKETKVINANNYDKSILVGITFQPSYGIGFYGGFSVGLRPMRTGNYMYHRNANLGVTYTFNK